MGVFAIGMILAGIFTVLFFIVFFSFIYYWHLTKVTYVIVPLIFTFEVFALLFAITATVSIIFHYLPYIIRVLGL